MTSIADDYGSTATSQALQNVGEDQTGTLLIQRPELSLARICKDPHLRGHYMRGMACQTARKTIEMAILANRELSSLLVGLQYSGLLDSRTTAVLNGSFAYQAGCGSDFVDGAHTIYTTSPGISIKDVMDQHFGISVDALTIGSALSWAVARTILPPIQRSLLKREETSLNQVIGNNGPVPTPEPSTFASKLSWLIEYIMPITFDAARYALVIEGIEKAGMMSKVWIDQDIDYSAGGAHFSLSGDVDISHIQIQLDPGQALISRTALSLLLALGATGYAAQALCNFHHDLQIKREDVVVFSDLSTDQKKKYLTALICRGIKQGTEVIKELCRSSLSTLSGLQLSGLFNAKILSTLVGAYSMNATCNGEVPIGTVVPLIGVVPPDTLEQMLDARIAISIETLTYLAAGAWLLSSLLIPPIQRSLSAKEESSMQQVLEKESNLSVSERSLLEKISSLIETALPVALDGAAYALLLHAFEKSNASFNVSSNNPETWTDSSGSLITNMAAGIYDIAIEILADHPAISEGALGIILTTGIMMYLYQAWCNFHSSLKKRASSVTIEEIP